MAEILKSKRVSRHVKVLGDRWKYLATSIDYLKMSFTHLHINSLYFYSMEPKLMQIQIV